MLYLRHLCLLLNLQSSSPFHQQNLNLENQNLENQNLENDQNLEDSQRNNPTTKRQIIFNDGDACVAVVQMTMMMMMTMMVVVDGGG
jgi:hypothetical protein